MKQPHELMKGACERDGKRTTRAGASMNQADCAGSSDEEKRFRFCKHFLRHWMNLSQRNKSSRLDVYTDAPEKNWSNHDTSALCRQKSATA